MVITGRTRNALALRGTWVQIPPSPRIKKPIICENRLSAFRFRKMCVFYAIFLEKCANNVFIFQKNVLCYYYSPGKDGASYEAKRNASPDKLEKRPRT